MALSKKNICIFCNGKTVSGMGNISSYWYCNVCLLGWLKEIPHIVYADDYYIGKSNIASIIFSPIANFFYFIRRVYVGLDEKKVWVDCGAGEGGFLQTVHSKKKIGVEISSSGRKMMKEKGILTLSDEEFLVSKNLQADVISFWHVIEHLVEPTRYLSVARKNLSKNGKIVLGIPNHRSFEFRVFGKHWFHLVQEYHIWHFSPKSITQLLNRTGFTVKYIDNWSIEHHLTGILQSFINKSAGSDSVLHRLVKRGLNYSLSFKDIFWSIFWLSIGLPIVLLFWLVSSIFNQSGTIVIVATKSKG